VPLACAVIAAALGGCGGGGSSGDSAGETPEPKHAIGERVAAFEKAAATLDCADALQVIHPVDLTDPEHPESKRNCAGATTGGLRDMKGFKATDSQQLGTAAVADGEVGGKPIDLIWALDESGDFKWIGGSIDAPQVGTEPGAIVNSRKDVDAFLAALRDGDCKAAYATMARGIRLDPGSESAFCKGFAANFTATPETLGSRLRHDPGAEPVAMGATQNWAVYGIATKPAGYRTLVVGSPQGKQPGKIFDVVPAGR
jgi:uncharacterized protein (DUF2147 family)